MILQDDGKAQTGEEKLDFLCGKGEMKSFFVPQNHCIYFQKSRQSLLSSEYW